MTDTLRDKIERILDELLFSGEGSLDYPFEEGKCINQILALIKAEIEGYLLSDEEIYEAAIPYADDQDNFFVVEYDRQIAQAQLKAIKDEVK